MQIETLHAREILDSRGNPTVEVDVVLNNGKMGRASVPSGASTGTREACELRDGDSNRYLGKGVTKAINNINQLLNSALKGQDVSEQEQLDAQLCQLDNSANKSHLGANTLLAVSLAAARAYANTVEQPLYVVLNQKETMCMPVPMINVLNGGAHADNNLAIQEFMLMPVGAADFTAALQMSAEIFHGLKKILQKQGLNTAVGDEGGFAPNLHSNRQALDLLSEAVVKSGFTVGKEICFALDVAASELYADGYYHFAAEKLQLNSEELINYYRKLITDYPIVSIEDGLDENDWSGWQLLTKELGKNVQLVGDDLFVTNPAILQEGINQQLANAILIKLNQIGTLSETRAAIKLAQANNYGCIISHRSGETEDTFIADLAVATGAGQIKTGSLCRTDRVAKYNQLLRIQEAAKLPYAGNKILTFHK